MAVFLPLAGLLVLGIVLVRPKADPAAALRVDKRQRFVSERKAYLPLFARCEPDAPEAAELSGRAYR